MILVLAGSSPVGHPNSHLMEGAAEWSATGLENQGTVRCRGSIPPPSFLIPYAVVEERIKISSIPRIPPEGFGPL